MIKQTCFVLLTIVILQACGNTNSTAMLEKDKLIAWCIVPFDAMDRNAEARAVMLNELGITRYAYDYRDKHLPLFEEEIKVMEENEIAISAVWLWIQEGEGRLLDESSEFIVTKIEETGLKTQLWISFPDQYFAGLTEMDKLEKAVGTIGQLNNRMGKAGCSIALYNHGDWFGEPKNQVKIIEAIGSDNISIVYNFHHGHHHIAEFEELVPVMLPYLTTLNLNGMNPEGPKILDIGKGTDELRMLESILDAGYDGEFGIIGHTEGEDIQVVLQRNLEGLAAIISEL